MNALLRLFVITCLVGPAISHAQKAEMPVPTTFNVGDRWEWHRIDNRTKLLEGKNSRNVVNVDGVLLFSNGTSNSQISQAFIGAPASKPWRVWPLEVGKKWVYDSDWVRADGVSGNTKQDAEVIAYEEVTVPAGKFMAFKIEYRGWYRNSQGGNGKQNDTFWYASDAYADVKHIRDDGFFMYTRELVTFNRAAPVAQPASTSPITAGPAASANTQPISAKSEQPSAQNPLGDLKKAMKDMQKVTDGNTAKPAALVAQPNSTSPITAVPAESAKTQLNSAKSEQLSAQNPFGDLKKAMKDMQKGIDGKTAKPAVPATTLAPPVAPSAIQPEIKEVRQDSKKSEIKQTSSDNIRQEMQAKTDMMSMDTVTKACKGDRWLGTEQPAFCTPIFLHYCITSNMSQQAREETGCPTAYKYRKGEFDVGDRFWRKFAPEISKQAILNDQLKKQDIDNKITYFSKVCGKLFPKLDTRKSVDAIYNCNKNLIASVFPFDVIRIINTDEISANSDTTLSSELKNYAEARTISHINDLNIRIVEPLLTKLIPKEDEEFIVKLAPEAKPKIDETIAQTGASIETLRAYCSKINVAFSLAGEQNANDETFLKVCERYSTAKLDAKTGGKASRDQNAAMLNEKLKNLYTTFGLVQACYESRKEFKVQYITAGQLGEAKELLVRKEAQLINAGANKDAARKASNDQSGSVIKASSASDSNYSERGKKSCNETYMAFSMIAS